MKFYKILISIFKIYLSLINLIHCNIYDDNVDSITTTTITDTLIPNICEHNNIDTAAQIKFNDNFIRYFISNGHYYWLFNNVDNDNQMMKLNEEMAIKIPYNFVPDIAIIKDTSECKNGYRSLLLIQMKKIIQQIEWFQLEMKLNDWNSSKPYQWMEIENIANCINDVCTTTDKYFMTMSFDFKIKLDSAFGVIGNIAYFIQQQKLYKVVYKNQCIQNPFQQIITYPGYSIGTTTTAALINNNENNTNDLILFDHNVHYRLSIVGNESNNLINIDIDKQSISKPSNWFVNNPNYFHHLCPETNFLINLNLFFRNFFTNSKHYYYLRRFIQILILLIFLICLLLILFLILCKNNRPNRRRRKQCLQQTNLDSETIDKSNSVLQTNC